MSYHLNWSIYKIIIDIGNYKDECCFLLIDMQKVQKGVPSHDQLMAPETVNQALVAYVM
jgi:hypothetical protein